MLRKLQILFVSLWCCIQIQAQLEFDKSSLTMNEVGWYTETNVTIPFTNTSKKPITITKILSSSCQAVPKWDAKSIGGGKKGAFTVTFKADLLGHFQKALLVYTDASEKPYVLKLTGNVVTKKESLPVSNFAYKVGDVWLSTDNIEFDDASTGEYPQQIIYVKNAGTKVYHPELMHLPKYLSQQAEPEQLLPGRSGRLVVTLNTNEVDGFGLKQTSVYLSRFPGDKVGAENEVAVSAVVLPPFDTTSVVQSTLAPCLEMDQTELKLPSLDGKSKVSGKLEIRNTGKSSLEITSLQVFNPAVNVSLGQSKIAPKGSAKLKISVLSKYMKQSRSRLRVLMITNDPKHSKVIITVQLNK